MRDPDTIRTAILSAVHTRGPDKTLCPSEVTRALSDDWRALMPQVRAVAATLADAGHIVTTQKGRPIDARTARGPIRLGLPPRDRTVR
ncbi:MAG: DUF3253 domain-containing protein [Pseudomonadota bacterium]